MPHFRRKVAKVLRPSLRQASHVAPTHHESEMKGGALHTRAEMELLVDMDSWVPDWLFATMLRRDLEILTLRS